MGENTIESDCILIKKVKESKINFSIIYNRNYAFCKNVILRKGISIDDANDIYQETMIFLYDKIMSDNFQLKSKITTYIYGIIKNKLDNLITKNSKFVNINTSSLDNDSIPKSIIDKFSYVDNYKIDDTKLILIKNIISKLSPSHNKIINLYLSGMNNDEIGLQMGYNTDTLKTAKYKAIQNIKKEINKI